MCQDKIEYKYLYSTLLCRDFLLYIMKTASSLFNFAQYFKQSDNAISLQAVTGSKRESETLVKRSDERTRKEKGSGR